MWYASNRWRTGTAAHDALHEPHWSSSMFARAFPTLSPRCSPRTTVQTYIVHSIRSSLGFVAWQDRRRSMPSRALSSRPRPPSGPNNGSPSSKVLGIADTPLSPPNPAACLQRVILLFTYHSEIRRMISTTNTIQILHRGLRKIIKTHRPFPSDEVAANLAVAQPKSRIQYAAASYLVRAALLLLMFGPAVEGAALTQAASSILPPDRSATANWRTAGMLSVGGIPIRTAVCRIVRPLGGGNDDTTNIQNAINACPAGQVVELAAGTFTIAEGNYVLVNKAVTVRGAGAGSTILQRTDGAHLEPGQGTGSNPSPLVILGVARFGPWYGNPDNSTNSINLTADGAAGSTTITLDCGGNCSSKFSVGQIVLLDEVSSAGWEPDVTGAATAVWAAPDYRVTWKKHKPSLPNIDDFGVNQYPYQAGTNGDQYSRLDRPTNELKEIASISGNAVTFTSPFTISYRVSHEAQLTWFSDSSTGAQVRHVGNAGVESLSMRNGDAGNIEFKWCVYCWAKNVESSIWTGKGIEFTSSFRCELREFYSHDAAYSRPGGGAYAIALDGASSEILIEDGISIKANKVIVVRASGAGSVVGYNYMDMGFIDYEEGWIEVGLNASHFVGSHHVLFEGNYGVNGDSDNTHGSSVYNTYFQNWLRGIRSSFTPPNRALPVNDALSDDGPKRAAGPMSYSYWMSFVGNVLGAPGQMSGWVYQGDLTQGPAIWALGWGDVDAHGVWHVDPQMINPAFSGHIIREGNWDWLTRSQKWDDMPIAIPDSLYRSSKPAFFGSNPWPWVNPKTGAVTILPAKARFDAGTPNGATN